MIDSTEAMNGEQEGVPLRDSRKAAFRNASRHSVRVRFLRRAILIGPFGGIVADRLSTITFDGNVRSTFEPNDDAGTSRGTARENAP